MNDFRKFKNNFLPNLSLIETLFCVIILANSIVALIETIDVWIRKDFIRATFRTLNHILIYFIVNVIFILKTYYGYFLTKFSRSIAFIVLKAIFLLLILLVVIIWLCRERKSLFVIVNSNRIMNTEIKEIYKWYHLQLTSCHLQILVAMFSEFTYISLLVRKYGYDVENPLEILKYLPWPNILSCIIALIMIKGVREESNRIMIVTYLFRLILYSIISIFLITITMINSIICHNKFGKGLKDYLLKEELEPFKESYYYKDDLDDYYERT
ncbi:hypothetical protein GLOIN_2v618031 [Rhizophagus irregularis DAOM 181602=DAOM 197198]|nr:hypothetical protein GLOIN_2v618031 [Rhizophagus irregularis DAOM 181602=DAOM 197198]